MLAGANIIYGAGMIELGQTFSLEQLVMDNEIIGLCRRAVRGIQVNEETVAINLIKEVGIGGDFLAKRHTLHKMKDEQSYPSIISRDMRGNWVKKGSKGATELAHQTVLKVLEEHRVQPIDHDVLEAMKAVVRDADAALRKQLGEKKGK
jgi:trimethylamine--corrinoid protein Co-methyltransferase